MKMLTTKGLQEYIKDYDYEVTKEEAETILNLLETYCGYFTSDDIQMVTDYVLNGQKSVFATQFN